MTNHVYDIFAHWFKTDGTNQNAVWIYSDPHFSDPEMVHLRKDYIGDDEQIARINKKVGKKDTLIILGDIGNVECVKKLHGYKVLIMGNHDAGASNYKRIKSEEHIAYMTMPPIYHTIVEDNHLFDEVYEGPLMINDRLILSHEPIETLPKYMFNIHGHDHSGWFKSDHHLNMCAEYINYTPVNLIDLIKHGLLKNVDSIHRITIDTATEKKAKRLKKAEEKANEVCDDSNK